MTTRMLAVVSAGLGVPSSTRLLADRLAAAAEQALEAAGDDVVVERVELREHAHAITDDLLTGFATGSLRAVLDGVIGADAVILVTPVFSASYSGLFKSFMDVLEPGSLTNKPVLIAATGGKARHSLALEYAMRPLLAYARATVAPTAVYAASEDWSNAGSVTGLDDRVRRAAGELAALVRQSAPRVATDPFDEVTPFERLLSGEV